MPALALGDYPDLRRHRVFESSDVDETRELISSIMQPHVLTPLGSGPCRSHMDYFRVGAIGFGAIKLGAMRVDVEQVADYHLMIFCLSGRAVVRAGPDDIAVDDTVGVLSNPGQGFSATFSPDAEQFVMRLDRRRLRAHLGRDAVFERRVDLRRPELRPLVWQMQALNADTGLAQSARADPRLGAHVESLLIGLLFEGQPQAREAASSVAPASVRRAEAFMRAHYDRNLTLDELAAAAGVAPRTLHEGFRRFKGATPFEVLRDLRLDRARAELRRPGGGVSTVALRCGFSHFGRFAQAYKRRFGELPSAMRPDAVD